MTRPPRAASGTMRTVSVSSVGAIDDPARQECTNETKSLLSHHSSTIEWLNPSYDSVPLPVDDNVLADDDGDVDLRLKASKVPFALLLSSILLVIIVYLFTSRDEPFSHQIMLSELVLAPDVANETTTFCSLAQSMVPAWYQETVSNMPIFTPNVQPGDVYKTRKILLKTRDLLDVFSPVYPNATVASGNGTTNMWRLTRHYLNVGYMTVGEFQDLHNAHVMYSQELMEERRNVVLNWKREFEQFRETHDAVHFLKSPTKDSHYHKESRLFWKNAATLPNGRDSATASLQVLGRIQLKQVLQYLWLAFPCVSVLEEEAHQKYHNLRKQLRSVVDEYELFDGIMFPAMAKVKTSMTVLTQARQFLGDINDDWTAYSIYVENNEFYSEQQRLAFEIDDEWAYFKIWVHAANFEGAVQYLIDCLDEMPLGKSLCS